MYVSGLQFHLFGRYVWREILPIKNNLSDSPRQRIDCRFDLTSCFVIVVWFVMVGVAGASLAGGLHLLAMIWYGSFSDDLN